MKPGEHDYDRDWRSDPDRDRRTDPDPDRDRDRILIPFGGGPAGASNHPTVKVARTKHTTFVTVTVTIVIGTLAALQNWPPPLTLGALGVATGLWAVGTYRNSVS